MILHVSFAPGPHFDGGAEAVAVGDGARQLDLEKMDRLLFGQVTYEDLRRAVEFVDDDIERAVAIDVKNRRGPGAGDAVHYYLSALSSAQRIVLVGAVAIEGELFPHDLVWRTGFDAHE